MRLLRSAAPLVLAALAAACATTEFKNTWKAPDVQPLQWRGKRVAALAITDSETTKRHVEDLLASELNKRGIVGVPAYTILAAGEQKDKDYAKRAMEVQNIVGAVSIRLVDRRQEVDYVPGMSYTPGYWGSPYYGSFYGYYGYSWGAPYSPGYVTVDSIVSLEMTVYDLEQDKLVWGGMSESVNPESATELMPELAEAAALKMRAAQVFAP